MIEVNMIIIDRTSPPISINLGRNDPGMTLQREVKRDQWINYLVNGEPVKSPVDLDALLAGKYRLIH